MTAFNYETQEEGDWFEFFDSRIDPKTGEVIYDPPKADAAKLRIRPMGPFWEARRKGRKKQTQFVLNPSTRTMERVSFYEDLPHAEAEKENADAWDYAITGIEKAYTAKGDPISCTRENKLKLVELPIFQRFIGRVFQLLAEAGTAKEASEKN